MVNQVFISIADAGRELLLRRPRKGDRPCDIRGLADELLSNRGEALGTALARDVAEAYGTMQDDAKLQFFHMLLQDYDADPDAIIAAADDYRAQRDLTSFLKLSGCLKSPRQELFRRINMAPNGTETVLAIRADLLRLVEDHPEFAAVDADLRELLGTWFNRGFLDFRKIDWQTPAHVLEKLIAYEAVHAMDGWDDLQRRLADDRRCFAFFHPALPDEPLIFVEVALTNGIADAIEPLLDKGNDAVATEFDTAVFYSISNCQRGLLGISLGNFLIKQVMMELIREHPELKTFVTLSPIPGFRRWLDTYLEATNDGLTSSEDREALCHTAVPNWHADAAFVERVRAPLMKLCAHYLCHAKREQLPADPVARFHLANGAQLVRLNWMADRSERGLSQSVGMLVNYRYELKRIEANHEAYVNSGKVAVGPDVKKCLKV